MERICADTLHSLFYDHPSNGKKFFANSEPIIVREMLHDVLDAALQDVAELVDGIDLHVLVVPEPIELGAVYIVMGIKIVLRNTPLFHGLPQTVVLYHFDSPRFLHFSIRSPKLQQKRCSDKNTYERRRNSLFSPKINTKLREKF